MMTLRMTPITAIMACLVLGLGIGAACSVADGHPEGEHGHPEGEHDHPEGDDDHDEAEGQSDADHDEPDEVAIDPKAMARSGLKTATASVGALKNGLTLPAEVELNPDRTAHISPLVDGQFLSVDAALGESVTAGQELATLRSVALGVARAELKRIDARVALARNTLTRQKRLRSEGISARRALNDARLELQATTAERDAAHARLDVFGEAAGEGSVLPLRSPIAGQVLTRHATLGETVTPDDIPFTIGDLSRVWVIGRLYERDLQSIALGQAATVSLSAFPGRTWAGKIDYIATQFDPKTRTLSIRVEVDNPDGILRPGLWGSIHVAPDSDVPTGVVVPERALQVMGERTVVFVPTPTAGTYKIVRVTVGRSAYGETEVIAGLDPGEEIVVDGAFVLKSELIRSELGHGHAH